MRKNERYIFFKDTRSSAAAGSEGVPLTAQRSLAVDPRSRPTARRSGSTPSGR